MFNNHLNRKLRVSHGIHYERNLSQQRTLASLRLLVLLLAMLFYFPVNYQLGLPAFIVIASASLLALLLYFHQGLSNWISNHRYLEFLLDEVVIFLACYYSGGLSSPYILALFLPVMVHAVAPVSVEMFFVIVVSILNLFLIGITTALNWPLLINMAACLVIGGIFVNILVFSDFKILSTYAIHDGLTGLYTHQFFYDQLHAMVQFSSHGNTFSLIMIDLDEFKRLNDEYGHLEGDRVLKEIAETIKLNLRDTDVVARYGGDEFAVILPGIGYHLCRSVVERLRTAIISLGYFDNVSIGAALYPDEADNAEGLVSLADTRMYREKKANKTTCEGSSVSF